jgi:hypothetical protein
VGCVPADRHRLCAPLEHAIEDRLREILVREYRSLSFQRFVGRKDHRAIASMRSLTTWIQRRQRPGTGYLEGEHRLTDGLSLRSWYEA